ncbi:MAG TPA: RNB domain-containing ribonuclease [Candidatus Sulfotelmatobacter sp.]|jgi:exoribonuclease-2|nr:RNB domain-containing ribonuclease [Candidatus Sulfotelmatobacter sp.]
MQDANPSHLDLQATAKEIMQQYGFEPDFLAPVATQLANLGQQPQVSPSRDVRDMRNLLWSSIDNDTSRDLDQIEVVESAPIGDVKVMVGIADVDTFVPKATPIDQHAARETTTVYTGIRNFPMLPEQLSTGVTSLLENQDRLSVVIEFVVDADGNLKSSDVYRALVQNKAQLQYNSVGAWLEGTAAPPPKVAASAQLQDQLKLQSDVAQKLKSKRFQNGALNLQTDEVHPLVLNEQVVDVVKQQKNHATELIEDFMVAANGVVARLLQNVSSLRRIVRTPKRWDRIVQLAASKGEKLPPQPDSKALNDLLLRRKAADPDHFADLSLTVIKLIGPGEYVLERAGETAPGHFGLAVQDYTHSTAPNRRFADVVTQRLIKAMLAGQQNPYSDDELTAVASNCTQKEDAARKVEREMSKRLAAVAMQRRVGETFDAIVTGVTDHGTFVRVLQPHVEGLLAQGAQGLDVGDKLKAKLIRTDVSKGYIDFARA